MRDLRVRRLAVNLSHAELLLGLVNAQLGDGDGLALLVDLKVLARYQPGTDGSKSVVVPTALHRRPADDQRRAGLVNEYVVNLVDYRELSRSLVPLIQCQRDIPAQVVKPKLVIGPVNDVASIDLLARLGHFEMAIRVKCKLTCRILVDVGTVPCRVQLVVQERHTVLLDAPDR